MCDRLLFVVVVCLSYLFRACVIDFRFAYLRVGVFFVCVFSGYVFLMF